MDSRAYIPLTPSYARDPSSVAANPSSASSGLVSSKPPSSIGLAGNLFMAPRTISSGGGAPPFAVTRAPLSKLPNAPAVKKTIKKVSEKKKKKKADGSTRPLKKKLARYATDAAETEAPVSLFVSPAANAHNVFDGMPTRPREAVDEESNKRKRTINFDDDEEESSSDGGKRSPTTNSVAYSKPNRPSEGKKDGKEKKRKGDDELKNVMEAIVNARKEANAVRKMVRNQDAAAEERRVALEEKKLAMEEHTRLLEWEKYMFFIMDTSTLDEQQKEYVKLAQEEVLIKNKAWPLGACEQ
ncbi:hypothetical protein D1007_50301 [Hordeum vulgare]|nr:hypothetical protein D1007_50301 [Hordeum vulgare]